MRKALSRFFPRALARLDALRTDRADLDAVGRRVAAAHALRAEGYGARPAGTPLGPLVIVPRGVRP